MAALTALAVAVGVALPVSSSAGADASDIEGTWSFGGGAIAVQGLANGTFQGTVVSPTSFSSCEHPDGQVLWTDMRQRSDGSFWGYHEWYLNSSCEADAELGLTAWRVLTGADGSHTLEVCFSKPGDDSQPQIPVEGAGTGASYGCSTSSPLAPLPGSGAGAAPLKFGDAVTAPPSAQCLTSRSLRISLHPRRFEPLKEFIVRVNGKKLVTVKGDDLLKKSLSLENLPAETFRMKLVAITALNHRLVSRRVYHACVARPTKVKGKHHKAHG